MLAIIPMIMMLLLMFSAAMMMLFKVTSQNNLNFKEKMSPFECGFNSNNYSRNPFSSQFFMIMLLFLIFDVEIVVILSTPMSFSSSLNTTWAIFVVMFCIILTSGIFMEWKKNILKWSYFNQN